MLNRHSDERDNATKAEKVGLVLFVLVIKNEFLAGNIPVIKSSLLFSGCGREGGGRREEERREKREKKEREREKDRRQRPSV